MTNGSSTAQLILAEKAGKLPAQLAPSPAGLDTCAFLAFAMTLALLMCALQPHVAQQPHIAWADTIDPFTFAASNGTQPDSGGCSTPSYLDPSKVKGKIVVSCSCSSQIWQVCCHIVRAQPLLCISRAG
jgi:hypothetical protein